MVHHEGLIGRAIALGEDAQPRSLVSRPDRVRQYYFKSVSLITDYDACVDVHLVSPEQAGDCVDCRTDGVDVTGDGVNEAVCSASDESKFTQEAHHSGDESVWRVLVRRDNSGESDDVAGV